MLVMLTKMGGFELSEHLHRKVVPLKGNAALDFCGEPEGGGGGALSITDQVSSLGQ